MSHARDARTSYTLLRNTAWNYAGFGVNLAANLLVFPIVVRRLGDAAAGIWLVLGSVTGYMGLLHLGLVPALTRFVATALGAGHLDEVNRRTSTAMAILLAIGAVPIAALGVVPWLVEVLHVPAALHADAEIAFRLGFIGFTLQLPGHAFNALLNGAERQDRCNQVWIVSNAAKAAGTLVLVGTGFGLIAILWFDLLLIAGCGVLLAVMAYRAIPGLRITGRLVSRTEGVELLSFGGVLFVSSLSQLVIEQTDRLVIGAFLTVAMVTYYSAGWKIYMLAYAMPTTLLSAVSPTAAAMYGRGDMDGLRRLFLRMTKYGVAVSWPLVLSLAACAAVLLRLWMGPSFAPYAPVVHVLLIAFAVTAHNHVGYAITIATRRVGTLVWRYNVPQAVLNLAISIWLVRSLGITGVAIGTAVPAIALEYTFLAFVLGLLDLRWRDFWAEVVSPTLVPAVVCFLPLGALYYALGGDSLWLVPAAGACSLAYGAWFWFRSLAGPERAQIVAHVAANPLRAARAD